MIRQTSRTPICLPIFDIQPDEMPLRIGEWLVRRQLISRSQLLDVLAAAERTSCRIGDAVVDMELLQRESIEAEVAALRDFTAFATS